MKFILTVFLPSVIATTFNSTNTTTSTTTTESPTTSTDTTTSTTSTDSSTTSTSTITSTTTTRVSTTRVPSNETWVVSMVPKFLFGASHRRGYSMGNAPAGTQAACPTNREYCIDTRYSDEGTCMYPSPETVKECLDDTCAAHPANEAIFKSKKEDSYCKDWQQSPEGRVCHWTSDVFCSCSKFSIVYANAVFVPTGALPPLGYARTEECKYADNYKAKNRRDGQANNGDGQDVILGPNGKPLQRLAPRNGNNTEDGNSVNLKSTISAIFAACILVGLL